MRIIDKLENGLLLPSEMTDAESEQAIAEYISVCPTSRNEPDLTYNQWRQRYVRTGSVVGLQVRGGMVEPITVHYYNEPGLAAKGKVVFNGVSSARSVQQRLGMALGTLFLARDNSWEHPWDGGDVTYTLAPQPTETETTLDMAYLAATITAGNWPDLFCGECNAVGQFLPLIAPLAIGNKARQLGKRIVVPSCSAKIVSVSGAEVIPVSNIEDLRAVINGHGEPTTPPKWEDIAKLSYPPQDDFRVIKGQEKAKEALEIAIAGGHNLMLMGPPGEGKSALSKRAYTIAPPLSRSEALTVTELWQAAKRVSPQTLLTLPPFVVASKESSEVALIGGGSTEGPVPGLVTLAHKGVLFADEIFEWTRTGIESLRVSLQDKRVVISRKDWQVSFPADYQLIGAANPCPCGYWGHPVRECTCTKQQRQRYLAKVSGAVMDRIDLKCWVPPLLDEAFEEPTGEDSATIRERVIGANEMQKERYKDVDITRNAELGPGLVDSLCNESLEAEAQLKKIYEQLKLSTRGLDILRKIARTCADLRSGEAVELEDVQRASEFIEVPLPN